MPTNAKAVARTPLGDTFTFTRLEGRDEISRCFVYTVVLVSPDANVDPLQMLGQVVSIEAEDEPKRWFSGLVSDFRLIRIEDGLARYEAVVRPWLWFLSNTTDCRIFQNMSVIDIVEDIFSKYGIAKFEKRLQGSYPPREYCVQYDESDLDFVQRLLEHEGIFYFFEHDDGEHTLILADAMSKLKPVPGYETVEFNYGAIGSRRDKEYITEWAFISTVRPGAYVHTDFDFQKPGADLMSQSSQPFGHKEASGENYRQPGAHLDTGRGDAVAAIRREELQAVHQRIAAVGHARGLFSGCTFKLDLFPREDQNREYLVVSAEYRIFDPSFESGIEAEGETYTVLLGVAPTSIIYRPHRITPRPIMRGPQTATVVGPSGEEIYTDKYARVKVQFHWDREGKKDQNSSCFVRVSQTWAGSGWGFIQIPRIGQEVIVDFVEGDPDRPIITGRVYNASQMPPYGLPANATQSGWKSNSSKGGGGYNELMFEDKAGSELVNFQAQKDHTLLIKNDRTKLVQHDQSDRIDHDAKHSVGHNLDEDVGNNKTVKVGVDQTTNIGSNDTETVGHDRKLFVKNDEAIDVTGNSDEKIWKNHSQYVLLLQNITVGGARLDKVGGAETRSVGAWHSTTVVGYRSINVGGYQKRGVVGSDSTSVQGEQTVEVGKNQTTTVKGDQSLWVDGDGTYMVKGPCFWASEANGTFKSAKHTLIEAGEQLTLKCGSASIVMTKDGKITIEGSDITIKGSGKISVKADSDIVMKGSAIHEN